MAKSVAFAFSDPSNVGISPFSVALTKLESAMIVDFLVLFRNEEISFDGADVDAIDGCDFLGICNNLLVELIPTGLKAFVVPSSVNDMNRRGKVIQSFMECILFVLL